MHYKIKDVNKYVEMLTQFVYEENPPKNILLFEIKNKTVIENIIDKFPTTNFYVIDEPYFLNIMLDERYRGGKYTKRILDCEKLKTEQDVTKEELLGALESILKRIEVEDLVVIMNPPYGKRASIARKVVNYILESCPKVSELTCLSPIRSNYDHWNDIESIAGPYSLMDNFIGVEGANLKAYTVHYSKNSIGTFKKDKAEFLLNKRELELVNAITGYNKFHKKHYLGVSDSNFLNKLKKNVKDIYLKKENSENEIFINDSFETCIKQKRVFYKTIWTPVDGVHKQPNCWDHKFNLLNKDFLKEWKPSPCTLDFFIFENQKCKNNFSKWWYSCNEKIGNNKKQRIGLTNKILDCILKVFAGGASISAYYAYLPNLDWTRPWTDEEIIQELKDKAGLPQDWKLD